MSARLLLLALVMSLAGNARPTEVLSLRAEVLEIVNARIFWLHPVHADPVPALAVCIESTRPQPRGRILDRIDKCMEKKGYVRGQLETPAEEG